MILLPFETITIETPLTKEDTVVSLARNIEPEKHSDFGITQIQRPLRDI